MKDLLFLIIEGENDERFFKNVFQPILKEKYNTISYYQYCQEKKSNFEKFLNYLKIKDIDYYIFGDINNCTCITMKKNCILKRTNNKAEINNIFIIIKEIESWYIAGIENEDLKIIGINKNIRNTDDLTLEKLYEIIPEKYKSKMILFFRVILKRYDIKTAIQKNTSFRYVYNKIIE